MFFQKPSNDMPTAPYPSAKQENRADRCAFYFFLAIALLPVISVFAPRALSFLPGLIALVFYALRYFYLKEKTSLPKTLLVITGGICALSFISIIWAIDQDIAINRSIKTAATLIPGIFLVHLALQASGQAIKKYAYLLPIGFFTAVMLLSFEYLAGLPLYHIIHDIDLSQHVQLHEFNRTASVLAVLFIASFFGIQHRFPKKHGLVPIAVIAVMAPVFLITASQSAQLALICGTLIAALFPYSKPWAWNILKLVTITLVFIAPWLAIWLFQNHAQDIHALPHMGNGDQSASAGNRLEVWDYVSRYALQNPLYGFGVEATRAVEKFDSAEVFQKGTTILHPHNFALQAWIEFGVIGAVSVSALIFYCINKIQHSFQYASQRILLATLCMLISIAATGYGMWQGWWLGLILLATVYAIICARYCQTEKGKT